MTMLKEYKNPEFDVLLYTTDDVVTVSEKKDNVEIDFNEIINQGGTP